MFGLGFKNELLNVAVGVNGWMMVTEEDLSFDERTLNQFVLSGSVVINNIEPGFILRVPMDEYSIHDLISGLNVGVRLSD